MIRKSSAYFLTPAASLLSQLAAIPLVIDGAGAHAWASVAVGQSVGTIFALAAQLGWPITGPTEVAMANRAARLQIYGHSLIVRGALVVPCALLAAGVTWLIHPGYGVAAWLSAVAATAVALSPGWFFVGAGQPVSLLAVDTAPRVFLTLAGAGAVASGASLAWFPAALLLAPLMSCVVATVMIQPGMGAAWRSLDMVVIREQIPGAGQSMISASYKFAPLVLVSALAPNSAVVVYALGDRFLKLGLAGLRPMTQILQGWVPATDDMDERRRREVIARRGTVAAGAVSGLAFAALAGPIGRVASHETVSIPLGVAAPLGLAFGLSLMSLTSGLVLMVARGMKRYLITGSALAALITLISLAPLTMLFAATGAAVSVALSEIAVQVYQTIRLRRSR